jgi:hypothetical protein
VRAQETRALKRLTPGTKVILTHSRWCLLKRPENLTENQAIKLSTSMISDGFSARSGHVS